VRVRVRIVHQSSWRLDVSDLRTALYNWLLARHHGGHLVLRVDDLNQPVEDEGALAPLLETLDWLGLDWDEGPELQSERLDLYAEYARLLTQTSERGGPLGLSDVALRADGTPTTGFAQVVDDHLSAITHVLRDRRWRSCTPRQRLLYEALGWTPPLFVHLPQVVRADCTELRLDVGSAYRERGFTGLVAANHLARLGWSPRGKRALMSLDELASRFELDRVSHSPALFDLHDLAWYNRRHLSQLDAQEVTALLVPYWRKAYGLAHRSAGTGLLPDEWQQTLALSIREELDAPCDAARAARFAFVEHVLRDRESQEILSCSYAPPVLRAFAEELSSVAPYSFGALDAFVSDLRLRFRAALGIRSRDVMHVLRAALTGEKRGPCLVVACQLLGRERCLERARRVISDLEEHDAALGKRK
jgi:glutamyl/glutaminyl-tRNA synthetase